MKYLSKADLKNKLLKTHILGYKGLKFESARNITKKTLEELNLQKDEVLEVFSKLFDFNNYKKDGDMSKSVLKSSEFNVHIKKDYFNNIDRANKISVESFGISSNNAVYIERIVSSKRQDVSSRLHNANLQMLIGGMAKSDFLDYKDLVRQNKKFIKNEGYENYFVTDIDVAIYDKLGIIPASITSFEGTYENGVRSFIKDSSSLFK